MADQKILTTRIVLRNDTSNNFLESNPQLLKGEIALEIDTNRYKIGNGIDTWNKLPYKSHLSTDDEEKLQTLIGMLNDDEFGKVDDVKVNGNSVLQDKVANIVIATISYSENSQTTSDDDLNTQSITLHKIAKTGSYDDLIGKLESVDNLNSEDTKNPLSANQGRLLREMVQGIPRAKSYDSIQSLITALNGSTTDEFLVGDSLFITQTKVPDFWISAVNDTSQEYSYTDDDAFINAVTTNGSVQVGYYSISMLETQKVDLTDYVSKEFLSTQLEQLKDDAKITSLKFENISGVVYSDETAEFSGDFTYKTKGDSTTEVKANGKIKLPLKGSDTINITVSEDNNALQVDLDESVVNKIDNLESSVKDIEEDETIVRTTDILILNGGSASED